MPENNPTKKASHSPPERTAIPVDAERRTKQDEQTAEDWFSGIGAGIKGVSRKLLDQVPPEVRQKVIDQARTQGPGAAAAAIDAATLKTRNLKVKLALKTLSGLLKLLDSKDPKANS